MSPADYTAQVERLVEGLESARAELREAKRQIEHLKALVAEVVSERDHFRRLLDEMPLAPEVGHG